MIAWLVQNAVAVAPLSVCVAIVCRLVRPAPAACHALWLLVLLKLVVPPLPVWKSAWLDQWFVGQRTIVEEPTANDAVRTAASARRSTNTASRPRSGISARVMEVLVTQSKDAATIDQRNVVQPGSASATDETPSAAVQPLAERRNAPQIATAAWDLAQPALLSLWALGAIIAIARHLRRVVRLRRVLTASTPPPQSFAQDLAVECRALGIGIPHVRLCTGLPCPMVIALPRATLLWPATLDRRLAATAMRAVLLHELAHLKRRDHLTAWLEVAVVCLWWWHPVVWWVRRELREYAELACDAWVIAQMPDDRTRYAKTLVDVCEFISLAKPATAPAVGMARGNRRSFERRLHMILRQRIAAKIPFIAWLSILCAALLVVPSFTTGQDPAPTPTDPAAASDSPSAGTPDTATQPTGTASDFTPSPASAPLRPKTAIQVKAVDPKPVIVTEAEDKPESPGISKAVRSLIGGFHLLEEKVLELQKWIVRSRGKGRSPTLEERQKAREILQATTSLMRSSGFPDKAVVSEIHLQILGTQPDPHYAHHWLQKLRGNEFDVGSLVEDLIRSREFVDGPRQENKAQTVVRPPLVMPESARSKQAPAQTLLRVAYDMPRDKSEALAKFLKDHVAEGDIDLRTVESGLIVTAEESVQRTIVGLVSLMTGERVSLVGHMTVGHETFTWRMDEKLGAYNVPPSPATPYPSLPHATPPTYGPARSANQPVTPPVSQPIQRFPGGVAK
ncbi:MAG: M56 family metallopeptidase [Pirellulales bacterium]